MRENQEELMWRVVSAQLIAVMDWSYSPEHGAPAITRQDDFPNLHIRQL